MELNTIQNVVADTSLLVAYLLEYDAFHLSAQEYFSGMDRGNFILHLPMLVMVETISAIRRRQGQDWQYKVNEALATIYEWERQGRVIFYPLNRERMEGALRISIETGLKGADSVIAALAAELGYNLKTFDHEILRRFRLAV